MPWATGDPATCQGKFYNLVFILIGCWSLVKLLTFVGFNLYTRKLITSILKGWFESEGILKEWLLVLLSSPNSSS